MFNLIIAPSLPAAGFAGWGKGRAGADVLVSGTALFRATEMAQAISELRDLPARETPNVDAQLVAQF